MKKFEAINESDENRNSFISFLLERYKKQQQAKENQQSTDNKHKTQHNYSHNNNYAQLNSSNIFTNSPSSNASITTPSNKKINEAIYNNYGYMNLSHHETVTPQSATSKRHTSVNNENKPIVSTKNSLKISQIIDTMSQQQQQQQQQQNSLNQYNHQTIKLQQQPPNALKIQPPTQMIKLNTQTSQHQISTPQQPPQPSVVSLAQPNSTIVKLSPSSNQLAQTASPAQPQTPQPPQSQQIKHLVLPKSNQKLIILPNSNSTNTTTPSEPSGGNSPNIMSKLVLYKTTKSIEGNHENGPTGSTNVTTPTNSTDSTVTNGTSSTQLTKNLKILSSPSIITVQGGQTANQTQLKPPVLFSVNNNHMNSLTNHPIKPVGSSTSSHHHLLSNLKPIKIIESGGSTVNGLDTDNGPIKRKFQLTNDHLIGSNGLSAGNASSPSSSSSNLNIVEHLSNGAVNGETSSTSPIVVGSNKIVSMVKSGSNSSLASMPNLVCLKLDVKMDPVENGVKNGALSQNEVAVAPKRIKLVDVDLSDEQNNQKI
jgi:hypothetical protein